MTDKLTDKVQINTLTLGALQTNCYLVNCVKTLDAIIIDPADDGETIVEEVLTRQLHPLAIILTHGHFDHVLGCLSVKLAFDIPIYLHPSDNFLIKKAQASAEHWTKLSADPVPPADRQLVDGQIISFGQISFQVIHSPGHTPGSCTLLFSPDFNPNHNEANLTTNNQILFAGDVIFKDGFGRTDFQYSRRGQLFKSIDRIRQLAPNALTYPGHGEPFYL